MAFTCFGKDALLNTDRFPGTLDRRFAKLLQYTDCSMGLVSRMEECAALGVHGQKRGS